jgi:hypothetical protein
MPKKNRDYSICPIKIYSLPDCYWENMVFSSCVIGISHFLSRTVAITRKHLLQKRYDEIIVSLSIFACLISDVWVDFGVVTLIVIFDILLRLTIQVFMQAKALV